MIGVPRSEWGNQAQWAVTAPLLLAGLGGVAWATPAALGLCAISTLYYLARLRDLRAYRVQVRLGFMAVLGLAFAPGFAGILWIPLVGTTLQVLVGYCPMARLLDLMPWNRPNDLDWKTIVEVITRRPGDEGILLTSACARRGGAALPR